jgi:hypothetical protein
MRIASSANTAREPACSSTEHASTVGGALLAISPPLAAAALVLTPGTHGKVALASPPTPLATPTNTTATTIATTTDNADPTNVTTITKLKTTPPLARPPLRPRPRPPPRCHHEPVESQRGRKPLRRPVTPLRAAAPVAGVPGGLRLQDGEEDEEQEHGWPWERRCRRRRRLVTPGWTAKATGTAARKSTSMHVG